MYFIGYKRLEGRDIKSLTFFFLSLGYKKENPIIGFSSKN